MQEPSESIQVISNGQCHLSDKGVQAGKQQPAWHF